MSRRLRIGIGVTLAVLAFVYGAMWFVGSIVWMQSSYEEFVGCDPVPISASVTLGFGGNAVNDEWSRSVVFPLSRSHRRTGPEYVFTARFDDASRLARWAVIHSGKISLSDGTVHQLHLQSDDEKTPEGGIPFFQNASRFIVHTWHPDPIEVTASAIVELDVEVAWSNGIVRKTITFEVDVGSRSSSRMGVITN